jgi:hypothetical protein
VVHLLFKFHGIRRSQLRQPGHLQPHRLGKSAVLGETRKPQPQPLLASQSGTCTASLAIIVLAKNTSTLPHLNQPPSLSFIPSSRYLLHLDEPRNPLSTPQTLPPSGINRSSRFQLYPGRSWSGCAFPAPDTFESWICW